MWAGLLALAPALALGYLVVAALSPGRPTGAAERVLRVGLATGLGLGLTSIAFFAAVVLLGSSRGAAIAGDAGVAALAGVLWRWRIPAAGVEASRGAGVRVSPLLRGAALAVLLAAVVGFASVVRLQPHGEWDAWAVWNQRARFLARGGASWRDAFALPLAWAPPHPLLVPGTVARAWLLAGRDGTAIPAAVAGLFTFATAAVLGGAVAVRRGEAQGLLATLTLLATPAFIRHGASQYADTPLGFFLLAALALGWGRADSREDAGRAALAGLMLGLAAWTKTEALLLVGAVLMGRVAALPGSGRWRPGTRELVATVAGLAPGVGVLAYFRLAVAPPNALLVAATGSGALSRLMDPARHLQILAAAGGELLSFDGWIVSAVALLAAYALVAGRHPPAAERGSTLAAAVALGVILAGYYLVLVVATVDLDYYLPASLPRLLLQVWPAALLAYWLGVRAPRERATPGAVALPRRAGSGQDRDRA